MGLFSGVVGEKEDLLGPTGFFFFKRLGTLGNIDGFQRLFFLSSGCHTTAQGCMMKRATGVTSSSSCVHRLAWDGGGSRHRVHRWPKVLWGQLRASRRTAHPE